MSYYFLEPPIPLSPPTEPYPFPLEALPENIRYFAESVANTTQVHPDMPAVLILSVLSACAQGKRFCQKYKSKQLNEALLILEEHNYLRYTPDNPKNPDRQHGIYELNPYFVYDRQANVNPLSI